MHLNRSANALLTGAILGATTLGLGSTDLAAGTPGVSPAFVRATCPAGVFPADRDVDCGFIRVPEDRSRPNGPQIKVAAALVHATAANPAPDPIVFLAGGPSFGAISPFPLDVYFAGAPYAEDHDVILVDTRGTGTSTPRLGCPELDEAEVKAFYTGPTVNSHALSINRKALGACYARLVAAGVDPADYDTAESAADLEDLRQALGVGQWNLLAESADGVLGLTYMRLFPDGIRSTIVDSGMSSNALWVLDADRGQARILESIFAGCHANLACRDVYPGIRDLFYDKVAQLSRDPVLVTFPDFQPRPIRLDLDGVGLLVDTVHQFYPGDLGFPQGTTHDTLTFMWRATHGDLVGAYRDWFGTGPYENPGADNFVAQGKTMSYLCRDLVSFLTPTDLAQAAHDYPLMASRYLHPDFDLANGWLNPFSPAGCRYWPVGKADPVQHQPVQSAIPTLVLTSKYDVLVPPTAVRPMVPGLSRSTYVELPASAHLQLASYTTGNDCSRAIATAFLARPTAAVDTSCVDALPDLDFTPPTAAPRVRGLADVQRLPGSATFQLVPGGLVAQ
jgi:pimeloyl-ACP methyl ester carboxylesterase